MVSTTQQLMGYRNAYHILLELSSFSPRSKKNMKTVNMLYNCRNYFWFYVISFYLNIIEGNTHWLLQSTTPEFKRKYWGKSWRTLSHTKVLQQVKYFLDTSQTCYQWANLFNVRSQASVNQVFITSQTLVYFHHIISHFIWSLCMSLWCLLHA